MSNYIFAILAGVLQGLTEFLPISSSGHLVLFHEFFGFRLADDLFFDVALHLATLLALLLFFYKDVIDLISAFFQSFIKWDLKNNIDQRLSWFLLIGTIPAAIAGYFFETQIELMFRGSIIVAFMLIAVGLILYLFDQLSKKINDLDKLGFWGSILIGIFQVIALIPGTSRSGITIIAGLSQKLKRDAAARYSFLLSMPIVFGAGIKKVLDLNCQAMDLNQWLIILIGFVAATVTGFFTIKYFLKFLSSHSLKVFALYRIILGFVILITLYLVV
ncbi:undecaprenyl-diphosphatase UppP [Patescibacteria group bacterium]|nr:undecaprenyl-diphosphatase UppP [Patescibacteria group bacterium]